MAIVLAVGAVGAKGWLVWGSVVFGSVEGCLAGCWFSWFDPGLEHRVFGSIWFVSGRGCRGGLSLVMLVRPGLARIRWDGGFCRNAGS